MIDTAAARRLDLVKTLGDRGQLWRIHPVADLKEAAAIMHRE